LSDIKERWVAGFDDGGIWVLDLDEREYPVGMMGLRNAFTMEERCRVIEKLGGTYFQAIKSAPSSFVVPLVLRQVSVARSD